jgi:hypothetical protein
VSLSRSPNKMFPFNHRSSSYLLLVVTILGALSSGGGMKIANNASEVAQSEVLVFESVDGVSATDVMNGAAVEAAWAAAGRARDGGEARPKHQRSREEMSKKNGRHPWKKNGKNGKNGKNKGRDKNGASELSSTRSDWRTTGVTFYGQTPSDDNGVGITGVDLFKYGKAGIRFKGEVVYPAAVFQGHAATFLYKVLEVTSADFKGTGRVFVHVVDVCNSCSVHLPEECLALRPIPRGRARDGDGAARGGRWAFEGFFPGSGRDRAVRAAQKGVEE